MWMSSVLLQKIFIHFYLFMLKKYRKRLTRLSACNRQLAQTFSPKRNKRIDRGIFIYERCLWKAKKKSSY